MLDPEAVTLDRRASVRAVPIPTLRRELSPLDDARAALAIARLVRRVRREGGGPVLVHTHSSKAGIVGRWGARLGGARLVVHTAHGFGHAHHGGRWTRRLLRLAERVTGRITDGFTADSAANVHQGRAEGLFGEAPARVVRCGVDLDRYAAGDGARARAELGIPSGAPVVLNLSCLKPQKDPVTYVVAAAAVLREVPGVAFLLAGDGALRGAVEDAARRHGIEERFRLLGWRRDVPDLLAASDVLALTSRWEGLPQSLFQAMAAGLPVVATEVDGTPEAVDHGETGLLCRPGDARGIARALLRLLGDAALRRRMGEAARQRVEAFSQDEMVASLERFYEDLVAARGAT